ncbi:MAG: hypothetical protein WCV58_03480 [Patescibacteria group bacterium]|jgi:hypothetical protein
MKTLFLYVAAGEVPVPSKWKGLNLMVENEGRIGHVVDNFDGNLVEIIDLGFHGYKDFVPDGGPTVDFLFGCGEQVAKYIINGPVGYDLVVAGQTPVSEYVVTELNDNNSLLGIKGIFRFSSYYGSQDPPCNDCSSPRQAGYDYDFPKDFTALYELLIFLKFSQRMKDGFAFEDVVEDFNLHSESLKKLGKPILPLFTTSKRSYK